MMVNRRNIWAGAVALVIGVCLLWSETALAQRPSPVPGQGVGAGENPNRPRLEDGAPQNPISIQYDDQPLLEVVKSIGALTGRNFEVDPQLKNQKVTIISHHDIQPEMAYEVLEAVLKARGYMLVETLDGNLVRVVQGAPAQNGISPDKLEIFSDDQLEPHIGFDNYAIHLVQLKYVAATQAAELLQKVGAIGNQVTVFENTNMLLIIDTADGVRNMFEVLKKIDVPGYDVIMEIFELKYTRAEALADQIDQVLGEGSGGGGGGNQPNQQRRPVVQPRNTRVANVPGQAEAVVVGSAEQVLRVVTDERLNALIVVASEGLMIEVRELINRLDVQTPFDSNNMHYVALMHTSAESVAGVLDSVTSVAPREGSEGGAQDGEVKPFEKKVTITPYEENNALVIIASPQDFAVLEDLIAKLDTPRKQVNIEAVIMEVTLSDDFSLSMEVAALDETDFFGLANVVDLANVLSAGPGALAGPGGSIGIIDGTTEVTLPGAESSTTVQNVPFLMRALETLTDVEILSRPNLMMKDNTEGQLNVGQEIGIPTSQSDINPSSGFTSRNSLSRRDVGIILSVTPQINEGDFVTMEIDVESSSTVDSGVGIDPNETGATIAKSNVVSEVVVQSGQTGIIGGLIRESNNRTVSQVPWLGDIPLLGNLFKGRSHGRQKQNLVILVTPRIIDREDDMDELTRNTVDDFYGYQFDAIFEKGFIKKIKAKHRVRHRNRPTDPYNPEKNGGVLFNSGRDVSESVAIEELEPEAVEMEE